MIVAGGEEENSIIAREHPQDKAKKFVIIDEISIENVIIKWPGYLYCKKR